MKMQKKTDFPSNEYNWLVEYLNSRQHCTKYIWLRHIYNAPNKCRNHELAQSHTRKSDLHPVSPENSFNKFADDTYRVVPASNSRIIDLEMQDFGMGGPKLRAKPESRARNARKFRAKSDPRAKPEKKWGRGLGRGLGEPLPWKFLKLWNDKRAIWCIFEVAVNHFNPTSATYIIASIQMFQSKSNKTEWLKSRRGWLWIKRFTIWSKSMSISLLRCITVKPVSLVSFMELRMYSSWSDELDEEPNKRITSQSRITNPT